jgi:hypothetical protein
VRNSLCKTMRSQTYTNGMCEIKIPLYIFVCQTWGLVYVRNFLIIKPTRWTNFSNLFWKWNSRCFGQFVCPPSGVIHCTVSNGICHTDSFRAAAGSGWNCSSILILLLLDSCLQTPITYTIAECRMNNAWWWTEELSETCGVSIPK